MFHRPLFEGDGVSRTPMCAPSQYNEGECGTGNDDCALRRYGSPKLALESCKLPSVAPIGQGPARLWPTVCVQRHSTITYHINSSSLSFFIHSSLLYNSYHTNHAMPYHAIPYHTIPYNTKPDHTIPCHGCATVDVTSGYAWL